MSIPLRPIAPGPTTMTRSLRRRGACMAQWLRLPGASGAPECASIRYWDRPESRGNLTDSHQNRTAKIEGRTDRSPIIFVHGYAGTEHIWRPLRDALSKAGFGYLVALRYNAFSTDIHEVADWLVDQAHRSMAVTGTSRVHLIGHSMGGLVVRDAVQNRGLAGYATTAVTIATPHSGTRLARFVPGPSARQMRPGSDFLTELQRNRADADTRWVTVHGGADRVVPQEALEFDTHPDGVLTVRQPSAGHGSITRHPQVVSSIVDELIRSETHAREPFSLAA